jgi:hypothetical protein
VEWTTHPVKLCALPNYRPVLIVGYRRGKSIFKPTCIPEEISPIRSVTTNGMDQPERAEFFVDAIGSSGDLRDCRFRSRVRHRDQIGRALWSGLEDKIDVLRCRYEDGDISEADGFQSGREERRRGTFGIRVICHRKSTV